MKATKRYSSLQVHPIATVEIEISLWSYEEETKKGKSGIEWAVNEPR